MPDPTEPVPHGQTARRLSWQHLPPGLRRYIEHKLGSPVVNAASQGGGFTPGFASVLTGEGGQQAFVKAASATAQRAFAGAYRDEGQILGALPMDVPTPRLLWMLDDDWVVLGIEYVESRMPPRPWQPAHLGSALATLATCAGALSRVPDQLQLRSLAEEWADLPALWNHVRSTRPDLPHLEEGAQLAATFADVTLGSTMVHTDVRGDNLLLLSDGSTMLCDWTWPAAGAPWVDTVLLLVEARGDGLDVARILAEQPLTRHVPPEHIDRVLALLVGFFSKAADDPVPPTSPHLRRHQGWWRDVTWDWLAERRGWT